MEYRVFLEANERNLLEYAFPKHGLGVDEDGFIIDESDESLVLSEAGNAVRIEDLDVVVDYKSLKWEYEGVRLIEEFDGDWDAVVGDMLRVREAAEDAVREIMGDGESNR